MDESTRRRPPAPQDRCAPGRSSRPKDAGRPGTHDGRARRRAPRRSWPSSEVALDHVDELLRRLGLARCGVTVRIDHVEANVAFHDFGHEAIDRPAACGDGLEDRRAFLLLEERLLDAVDLATNPTDAVDQL